MTWLPPACNALILSELGNRGTRLAALLKPVECRKSPAVAALGARLESVLELLAQLITIIKPPANSLLPVLRVAGQALTLQKHELLQLKATGGCTLSPWWHLCLSVCNMPAANAILVLRICFSAPNPRATMQWSILDQQAAVPTNPCWGAWLRWCGRAMQASLWLPLITSLPCASSSWTSC